jgi:hypothetical protein
MFLKIHRYVVKPSPGGVSLSNAAAGGIDRKHRAEPDVRWICESFRIRYLVIAGILQAGHS